MTTQCELQDKFYTYVYFETPQKPIYVGKGRWHRANNHINGKTHSKILAGKIRNLRAKGIEPVVKIIHTDSEEEAFELETFLITEIGRVDLGTGPLLNLTDGGDGGSGMVHTAETRELMSRKHKGRKKSEQTRSKISAYAKQRSPEHRMKLSEAAKKQKGKPKRRSPEHCAKISQIKKEWWARRKTSR